MVSILVTRPRASSDAFARELLLHGYEVVVEPLLRIVPSGAPMPDLDRVGAVMITSGNALDALKATHKRPDLFELPCFCVGPRTAAQAIAAGFQTVHAAAGDSAALATSMLEFEQTGSVLHIAGVTADGKAQSILEKAALQVIAWPIYDAVPVPRLSEATLARLNAQSLDAVAVFSVRTAEVLNGLLTQHRLEACCEALVAIGLSRAVADALRPLRWRKLTAAARPTEDAVITCLKQTNPVS